MSKARSLAKMFLVGHEALSLFPTLSSQHQGLLRLHLQTSVQCSPPCRLPCPGPRPPASTTVLHPLLLRSPALRLPPPLDPLGYSQNADLVMPYLCHQELQGGKDCFGRAVLKCPPSRRQLPANSQETVLTASSDG